MDTKHNSETKSVPTNKNELILFRLDAIDQKLVDLQVLMTQNALQDQKIAELQKTVADMSDYTLLREKVRDLTEAKKNANAKWWQIIIIALSPIISAIVMFALMGGLTNAK